MSRIGGDRKERLKYSKIKLVRKMIGDEPVTLACEEIYETYEVQEDDMNLYSSCQENKTKRRSRKQLKSTVSQVDSSLQSTSAVTKENQRDALFQCSKIILNSVKPTPLKNKALYKIRRNKSQNSRRFLITQEVYKDLPCTQYKFKIDRKVIEKKAEQSPLK